LSVLSSRLLNPDILLLPRTQLNPRVSILLCHFLLLRRQLAAFLGHSPETAQTEMDGLLGTAARTFGPSD
jgi:hypothetical protein